MFAWSKFACSLVSNHTDEPQNSKALYFFGVQVRWFVEQGCHTLHWSLEFIDCSQDSNRLLAHFNLLPACLSLLACLLFHSPIRWNLNHQIYENMIKLELEIFRFLDASSHLYKRVCPSVRRSVRPSVRRSVTHFFRTPKNAYFRPLRWMELIWWWRGVRRGGW